MSADLEQFYEVFFEESSELLAEMEACLLGLNINSPDLEDLNAIFRAAHSIKGGAGTFGFTDMTEMTHMLETLLDRLRKGELQVRSEMIDAFLKAGDVIKDQLAGHRGDGQANPAIVAEVYDELKRFSEETPLVTPSAEDTSLVASDSPTQPKSTEIIEKTPATHEQAADTENIPTDISEQVIYRIEFNSNGLGARTIENLLAHLKQQGALEMIAQPGDSELCKLRLTTTVPEEDVWEALAFIVDPAHLKIETETETEAKADTNATADETVTDETDNVTKGYVCVKR